MRLLKYIDRKFTLYDQKTYMVSFVVFGMPLGYLFSQGVNVYMKGWSEYHFSIYNLIGNLITNLVILTPIIYNYIRHTKKYNKIFIKMRDNTNTKYKVKALYNYDVFTEGISYEISTESVFMNFDKHEFLYVLDNHMTYPLKNIINKFELDDIKEDRMRKLKKLKRIWR